MKYAIILRGFQRFDTGTKPNKNMGKKMNGFVIGQSAKGINFNYSINFEIMAAVSDRNFL